MAPGISTFTYLLTPKSALAMIKTIIPEELYLLSQDTSDYFLSFFVGHGPHVNPFRVGYGPRAGRRGPLVYVFTGRSLVLNAYQLYSTSSIIRLASCIGSDKKAVFYPIQFTPGFVFSYINSAE